MASQIRSGSGSASASASASGGRTEWRMANDAPQIPTSMLPTTASGTVSSLRIANVCGLIRACLRRHTAAENVDPDLLRLLISLSRDIDYAVARNEVPATAYDLPSLIKQLYQRKNTIYLQSAMLLLMVSVKNACAHGWFSDIDSSELLSHAKEMSSNFSSSDGVTLELSHTFRIISDVILRFFPRLKLGCIIVSIEAKFGYEILVTDFHFSNCVPPSTQETIGLFVVQKDNIETSSCLISPPEVNFMLNGKGVEKRTDGYMDNGPQFPTDVTSMLGVGTNLMQAIGHFNGNYIIAVAYMSVTTSSDSGSSKLQLEQYVAPESSTTPTSDGELIEGPSRISLNCPISFKRIKTPVKGRICRHHQCFDYDNYMEINSRRPTWRCPHCNQPVSCCDIRIDKNMAKILSEVRKGVIDVLISSDGSWKVNTEEADNNGLASHPEGQNSPPSTNEKENGLEEQQLCESNQRSNKDFVDLTMETTDEADITSENNAFETEDRKPFLGTNVGFENLTEVLNNLPDRELQGGAVANHQGVGYEDMWSRILTSNLINNSVGSSGGRPTMATTSTTYSRMMDGGLISDSSIAYSLDVTVVPVLTDAVSPALNQVVLQQTASPQNVPHVRQLVATANNLQLQQQLARYENSIFSSNETVGRSLIPRHISRTPVAVQALPAQAQVPNLVHPAHHQRPSRAAHPIISSCDANQIIASQIPNSCLLPSPDGSGFNNVNGSDMEAQQPISRQQLNSFSVSDVASSSLNLTQNQDRQYVIPANQSFQSVVGLPATSQVVTSGARLMPSDQQHQRVTVAYRASSGSPFVDQQNHNNQQQQLPTNLMMPQPMSQSVAPTLLQQSSSRFSAALTQNIMISGQQQTNQHMAPSPPQQYTSQVATRMAKQPAPSVQRPSFPMSSLKQATTTGEQSQSRNLPLAAASGPQGGNSLPHDLPSEQNWRPTGWMRGSLMGRAYSSAINQLMLQPTQPQVVAQTVPTPPPPPQPTLAESTHTGSSSSQQLQGLIANNQTSSRTSGDLVGSRISSSLHDQSLGMH